MLDNENVNASIWAGVVEFKGERESDLLDLLQN